jgi:hypothetical protein
VDVVGVWCFSAVPELVEEDKSCLIMQEWQEHNCNTQHSAAPPNPTTKVVTPEYPTARGSSAPKSQYWRRYVNSIIFTWNFPHFLALMSSFPFPFPFPLFPPFIYDHYFFGVDIFGPVGWFIGYSGVGLPASSSFIS